MSMSAQPPYPPSGDMGFTSRVDAMWHDIHMKLDQATTEFQRFRLLENVKVCPLAVIRCAAIVELIEIGFSTLEAKYEDHPGVKEMLDQRKPEYEACHTGFVNFHPDSSFAGGRNLMYSVKVVRKGTPIGGEENQCLGEHLHMVIPETREDYYATLECAYKPISLAIRTMLVKVGWLREEYGPLDPEKRKAGTDVGFDG